LSLLFIFCAQEVTKITAIALDALTGHYYTFASKVNIRLDFMQIDAAVSKHRAFASSDDCSVKLLNLHRFRKILALAFKTYDARTTLRLEVVDRTN